MEGFAMSGLEDQIRAFSALQRAGEQVKKRLGRAGSTAAGVCQHHAAFDDAIQFLIDDRLAYYEYEIKHLEAEEVAEETPAIRKELGYTELRNRAKAGVFIILLFAVFGTALSGRFGDLWQILKQLVVLVKDKS